MCIWNLGAVFFLLSPGRVAPRWRGGMGDKRSLRVGRRGLKVRLG